LQAAPRFFRAKAFCSQHHNATSPTQDRQWSRARDKPQLAVIRVRWQVVSEQASRAARNFSCSGGCFYAIEVLSAAKEEHVAGPLIAEASPNSPGRVVPNYAGARNVQLEIRGLGH